MNGVFAVAWALIMGFALLMYIVFDGFDLGVGALLLIAGDEPDRDRMIESIAPMWDGNETWMILVGAGLLGGFPLAYGILLPAFYLPLMVMLLALAFRGASFELRFQTDRYRRWWDRAFCGGSIVAGYCQGLVIGGLLGGVKVVNGQFAGSGWDLLRPLPLIGGFAFVAGYSVIGACWLILKTDGALQLQARRVALKLLRWMIVLVVLFWAAAAAGRRSLLLHWISFPFVLFMPFTWLAAAYSVVRLRRSLLKLDLDSVQLRWSIVLFICCYAGIVVSIWPFIVPPDLSIWAAASPSRSQLFLLVGVGITLPVILAYSTFAYYVFRGKTPKVNAAEEK